MKTFGQSVAIGTAITLALFGLGYVAAEAGFEDVSYALNWPSYVLIKAMPCSVVLTPGEFLCESMSAVRTVFYAGLPLGVVVYSAAAWLVLRRRGAAPQAA